MLSDVPLVDTIAFSVLYSEAVVGVFVNSTSTASEFLYPRDGSFFYVYVLPSSELNCSSASSSAVSSAFLPFVPSASILTWANDSFALPTAGQYIVCYAFENSGIRLYSQQLIVSPLAAVFRLVNLNTSGSGAVLFGNDTATITMVSNPVLTAGVAVLSRVDVASPQLYPATCSAVTFGDTVALSNASIWSHTASFIFFSGAWMSGSQSVAVPYPDVSPTSYKLCARLVYVFISPTSGTSERAIYFSANTTLGSGAVNAGPSFPIHNIPLLRISFSLLYSGAPSDVIIDTDSSFSLTSDLVGKSLFLSLEPSSQGYCVGSSDHRAGPFTYSSSWNSTKVVLPPPGSFLICVSYETHSYMPTLQMVTTKYLVYTISDSSTLSNSSLYTLDPCQISLHFGVSGNSSPTLFRLSYFVPFSQDAQPQLVCPTDPALVFYPHTLLYSSGWLSTQIVTSLPTVPSTQFNQTYALCGMLTYVYNASGAVGLTGSSVFPLYRTLNDVNLPFLLVKNVPVFVNVSFGTIFAGAQSSVLLTSTNYSLLMVDDYLSSTVVLHLIPTGSTDSFSSSVAAIIV